jgi:hypothetical protein
MLEWLNIMDSADGWKVNFNWGDANAWKSDWDANDDSWVDSADFVFYTGHASLNGWLLVTPGTQNLVQLTPSVVGSVPARLQRVQNTDGLNFFFLGGKRRAKSLSSQIEVVSLSRNR